MTTQRVRRPDSGALALSREGIDRLLAGTPTPCAIAVRRASVDRLLSNLRHFVRWPALEDSFEEDLRRLSGATTAQGEAT